MPAISQFNLQVGPQLRSAPLTQSVPAHAIILGSLGLHGTLVKRPSDIRLVALAAYVHSRAMEKLEIQTARHVAE